MFHEPPPRISHLWHCPICQSSVVLHVRVVYSPICNNKAVHSRRHIDMKKTKKGK